MTVATADALMAVFGLRRSGAVLTLPYPPTVNTYWRNVRGRTLISATGRKYRTDVVRTCAMAASVAFGSDALLKVEIKAWMPDARRRDLDNITKAPLDALTHAGVYGDDSQIDDLHIVRAGIDRKNPRLEITIEVIQ